MDKVAFLSRGSSPAMTVNAVNKSKYTLCPVPACASPSPLPPTPTGAPASPTAAPTLAPSQQQLWVDRHNYYRNMVNVPTTSWDPIIAAHAQKYADELAKGGCHNLAYSSSDFRSQTKYGYLGENLYYRGIFGDPGDVKDFSRMPEYASEGWGAAEMDQYRFGPSGDSCTKMSADWYARHYTAMVWRTSTLLGCGMAYCNRPANGYYVHEAVAVCHYGAPESCSGAMCSNNAEGYYPFCAQDIPDGVPMCSGTSSTAGCT